MTIKPNKIARTLSVALPLIYLFYSGLFCADILSFVFQIIQIIYGQTTNLFCIGKFSK